MGKKNTRTHDEFVKDMNLIQSNVTIIGEYINSKTPILLYCNLHNLSYKQKPEKALIGQSGCPICAREKGKRDKMSQNEFVDKLAIINPNIEITGNYINALTNIEYICKQCGRHSQATPHTLLQGSGCIVCGNKRSAVKRSKTNEQFLLELNEKNPYVIPLEKYNGALTKIQCKCKKCGREWSVTPHSLLRGTGCNCDDMSYGEQKIAEYLIRHNIYFQHPKSYDGLFGTGGGLLSYDFYLPYYNLLIEYQGQQHEHPVLYSGDTEKSAQMNFIKQQEHDKRKRLYSVKHDIQLLEIWYKDYNNIDNILDMTLQIPVTTKAV